MKFALLLILLWSLVEVHSQTAPYLTFMGDILPNNSYVDLSTLGEYANEDDHVVCHTDLDTCCGGDGSDRGYWFLPNGTILTEVYDITEAALPIFARRHSIQIVRLIRGTGSFDAPSGIYRCDIETVAVNNPGSESTYVGVYSIGGRYSMHTTDYVCNNIRTPSVISVT